MVLKITENPVNGIENEEFSYQLEPTMLALMGTHAFIKSRKWDAIEIELSEKIPLGSLKYIPNQTDKLILKEFDTHSKHCMMLCTELYPEKAGTIRKTFLSKGEVPSELLC